MGNIFDMHIKLEEVISLHPQFKNDPKRLRIAKALLYTQGTLDAVEFLTDEPKQLIIETYQLMNGSQTLYSTPSINQTPSLVKQRSFNRTEMADYLKQRLLTEHPSLQFVQLKYNVLTCKLGTRTIRIYISTSRDYEKDEMSPNPYSIYGWHKGECSIFTNPSYDYYAFLVKAHPQASYSCKVGQIDGLLLSRTQVQEWLNNKVKNQSGMTNFYVHYTQHPETKQVTVKDIRENPPLVITKYYNEPFNLIH